MAILFQIMEVKRLGAALLLFCCALALFIPDSASGAEAPQPPAEPAEISVSGYGLFGNRELKRMLRATLMGKWQPAEFPASFIEDAALLLTSRVKRDGFLQPQILVRMTLPDGSTQSVKAADLIERPLERGIKVRHAEFRIRKGKLYYFADIRIDGLDVMSKKAAQAYFMETDTLLKTKGGRVYTPDRLKRGIASLTSVLERKGYQQASVKAADVQVDDVTGGVIVRIQVNQGRRHMIRSVRQEYFGERHSSLAKTNTVVVNKPYSQLWLQDHSLSLKTNLYHQGYPDAGVNTRILRSTPSAGVINLDLVAAVDAGSQVWVGDVKLRGQKHTSEKFMASRVPLKSGDLLDRIEAEKGRSQLSRLGIFNDVELRYDQVGEHTRDIILEVQEAKRLNLSLLFGWGSYELLRGGFMADAVNLWGRAHYARLKVIQSLKSSRGEFSYTIPALLKRDVDLFVQSSGLRREEIDFTRVEYGGGIGLHKYFARASTDVTFRYNYEILSAEDTRPAIATDGLVSPAVGSLIADVRFDRRDSPLYPRRGYKVFATVESANAALGGDANYQRFEVSPSWHQPLGGGRFLHAGIAHGVAISPGDVAENLPFNRRFFPGGDHSIRGFQDGEASPRNEEGEIVGAESYLLATVELEQALTPKWALVVFMDWLGAARRLGDYPFDDTLVSIGGGIRWKTVIGPVRLEYGHNLERRPKDPAGTLHFSLGFPF